MGERGLAGLAPERVVSLLLTPSPYVVWAGPKSKRRTVQAWVRREGRPHSDCRAHYDTAEVQPAISNASAQQLAGCTSE